MVAVDAVRDRGASTRRLTISPALPDVLIPIALAVCAFALRLNLPTDGLFHDDAWQVLGAKEGRLSDFPMVGQSQPGFTFALMGWERVFGSGSTSMVTPALAAGSLGPPALYLALRRFGFARSIAVLLGAILTVSTTHVLFSNRVKTYTADVLVVLFFAVAVPILARRPWTARTAACWFTASVIAAMFSPWAWIASVVAGVVLVLHPDDDRTCRLVSVAAQCVVLGGYLLVTETTYSSRAVRAFWSNKDSFITLSTNPLTSIADVVDHSLRVTAVFPGGGRVWEGLFLLTALGGIVAAAWRGPLRIVARYLALLAVVTLVGSMLHRLPFGPRLTGDGGRVTLWLAPVVAFGIAVVLDGTRRALRRAGPRLALDIALFAGAALVLTTALGANYPYPVGGARAATRAVMADLGPDDRVWIMRSASYPFALQSGSPVDLRATPERLVGYFPEFEDRRLQTVDFDTSADELDESLEDVARVFVVDAGVPRSDRYTAYAVRLAEHLQARGFAKERAETIGRAPVDVWLRAAD
jgi:hypothetical protein